MSRGRIATLSCMLFGSSLVLAAASASPPQQAPRLVLTDDGAELEKALASPSNARDLPIRLAAISLPADDPNAVRLLISASIDDPREGMSLVSVAYDVRDEKGLRLVHGLRRRELSAPRPGSFSFTEIVQVPPGKHRLRVAALRDGRVGSAEAPAVARLSAAGPVRAGDLVVGEVVGEEAVTAATPERRVRGDRVVVTLPVAVGAAMPPGVTLTLELATDASGAALLAAPISLIAGPGSGRLAQGVVDVRVLPSGNYVARVGIASAGGEAARLIAPFSLDRSSTAAARDAGWGASAPSAGAPGATFAGAATAFRVAEVLDAAVVAPFLDDLAPRSKAAAAVFDHARAGRFADAAGASSSLEPGDPARPFFEGLSLLSRNELQAASEAFRETLRAAPDYFVGAFYIGACYAAGGRDPQAVSAWQTSLVGLDQYPIVFRLIADALLRMRQADRAVETLAEASAKWPDDAELRLRLARAALEGRKYDRVTGLADAALSHSPAEPELLFAGMQAIFEQVTQGQGPAQPEDLARLRRYRDAYVSAGGSRQSLVSEWVAAVEKKLPPTAR